MQTSKIRGLEVDTLSGGLRLSVARYSPAKVLSTAPGLLQLPSSQQEYHLPSLLCSLLLVFLSGAQTPAHPPIQTRMNWSDRLPPRSGHRSLNPALIPFLVHPITGCTVSKHSSMSRNKSMSVCRELSADSVPGICCSSSPRTFPGH